MFIGSNGGFSRYAGPDNHSMVDYPLLLRVPFLRLVYWKQVSQCNDATRRLVSAKWRLLSVHVDCWHTVGAKYGQIWHGRCKGSHINQLVRVFQLSYGGYGNSGYGNNGYNSNQQGMDNQRQSNSNSFGNCKTFNILDPYCRMRPDECQKLFQECMKFGQGQQSTWLSAQKVTNSLIDVQITNTTTLPWHVTFSFSSFVPCISSAPSSSAKKKGLSCSEATRKEGTVK